MGKMIVRFPCLFCEKPVAKNLELFTVISVIGGYIDNAITSVRKHTETSKKLTCLGIVKTVSRI